MQSPGAYAKNIFPWLFGFAGLILIVLPTIHLWPNAAYMWHVRAINAPDYGLAFSSRIPVAESAHFVVYAPPEYLNERELSTLLDRSESSRAELVKFLSMPDDARRINMRLFPEDGIPYTGTEDINLFALKAGHTSVVHEMTHYLMGYPNGLAAEGLAILAEDRFGWGLSFPNMLRPVDAHMHNQLRRGEKLVRLADLRLTSRIYNRADPARSRLRYLQAGSFTRFLADQYGMPALLEVYSSNNYAAVFGKPLDTLEQDWLAALRLGMLARSLVMLAGGAAVIGLFHTAFLSNGLWKAAAWLALIAFFVWSYYQVYTYWLPAGMLLAVAAASVVARFSRRVGLALLWLLASAVLLAFLVLPALRAAL